MEATCKRILQKIFVGNLSWFLLKPFIYLSKRAIASRENFLFRRTEDECILLCNKIFENQKVLHGLFVGMNMKGIRSTGSNLYAKILGCYEQVVMDELSLLLHNKYENFINIGTDEGTYAVGIARIFPSMNVYVFDCNKIAQAECLKLATLNNIKNKFVINGCFDAKKIENIDIAKKTLFLTDCEGCENEIFTKEMIANFINADYIIELHYEKYPHLFEKLNSNFFETHNVKLLTAKSDFEIIKENNFSELNGLSFEQKKYILSERSFYTQWLVATSKK
jgi:hypothetical protein